MVNAHDSPLPASHQKPNVIPEESALFLDSTALEKQPNDAPLLTLWERIHRKFVLNFTPAYFSSVMGTGILANLLYNFPFEAHWLKVCGCILAVIALIFFLALSTMFTMALFEVPLFWSQIHRDVRVAPYMGCFVMGFMTLVAFVHTITSGKSWAIAIWTLWWIVTALSIYTAVVTFFMTTIGKHRSAANVLDPSNLSLEFLLPVVTLTVAASLGGNVAQALLAVRLRVITLMVSLLMWAVAMTLSLIIVAVNFWRLFIHKLPNSGKVMTLFLPIGFVGQGAYGILLFAHDCTTLLMEHSDLVATSTYVSYLSQSAQENNVLLTGLLVTLATSILVVCTFMALVLMSFGFFMTAVAYMSVFLKMAPLAVKQNADFIYCASAGLSFWKRAFNGLLKFHKGFWAMTFPLGTMAQSTGQLYKMFNGLEAFRYVSAIYTGLVVFTTLGCIGGAVYRGYRLVWESFHPDIKHTA